MLIRLEHKGRIIHEVGSENVTRDLVIGRSHACDWPIPREDGVASSRHAALVKKGRHLLIRDLGSTNGTFYRGKRIKKRQLDVGDKISLGNCVLSVEPDRGGTGRSFSEVVVLSGKMRGQKKRLKPPVFTIGSDPTASLVFLDMLVSRRHAEIAIKEDGSCWIRDLGSKNGTSVNDMPLRDDKERLLKEGDRIACSHFELEFHDGAIKRSNRQTWLRVAILLITLLAGLGAYQTYQRLKPSAKAYVASARRLAAREAFDEALAAVDQAVAARHAVRHQVAIEELRRLIAVWKHTRARWQRAQEALAQGDWVAASRTLGVLQAGKREVWEWNAGASLARDQATRAKALLDAYLQSDALLNREDALFEELVRRQAAVAHLLAPSSGSDSVPAYLTPLHEALKRVQARQDALVSAGRRLEEALDTLTTPQPPFEEILRVLAEAKSSAEPLLKKRAEALTGSIGALAQSMACLATAADHIRQMAFSEAAALDLALPAADVCALDTRVSRARHMIEQRHAALKQLGLQAGTLWGEVEKRLARDAVSHEGLLVLRDSNVMSNVLACDSIRGALPKRSRSQPAGAYDRVLGVEAFYAYLSALPEPLDPAIVADLPFEPLLNQAREALRRIERFLAFMERPENQWMNGGTLGDQIERLRHILKQRDALVVDLLARAAQATDRTALITAGIAARLAMQHDTLRIKGEPLEAWLAQELKRQRAALLTLNERYTMAPPMRQIEIRGEVLSAGLPGDPVVRRMWAMKDAAAAMKALP